MISVDQAYALSTEVGWNQTRDDWRRILALAPNRVYGIERDGRLVSSAVGLPYGRELAWIGMVLTSADYRGQGFARALMQRALDDLAAGGGAIGRCHTVGIANRLRMACPAIIRTLRARDASTEGTSINPFHHSLVLDAKCPRLK